MVVLQTNSHDLKDTYLNGPADICVEVVSEKSSARDHGEKFVEYEKGGVPEYWIIDPIRRESRFYRLGDQKSYLPQSVDHQGNYHTPTLPGLALNVPTLWHETLPGPGATFEAVKAMLNG